MTTICQNYISGELAATTTTLAQFTPVYNLSHGEVSARVGGYAGRG